MKSIIFGILLLCITCTSTKAQKVKDGKYQIQYLFQDKEIGLSVHVLADIDTLDKSIEYHLDMQSTARKDTFQISLNTSILFKEISCGKEGDTISFIYPISGGHSYSYIPIITHDGGYEYNYLLPRSKKKFIFMQSLTNSCTLEFRAYSINQDFGYSIFLSPSLDGKIKFSIIGRDQFKN